MIRPVIRPVILPAVLMVKVRQVRQVRMVVMVLRRGLLGGPCPCGELR
ncbi:hypothetical protein AB0D71_31765 [Streptomyces avermitilis]